MSPASPPTADGEFGRFAQLAIARLKKSVQLEDIGQGPTWYRLVSGVLKRVGIKLLVIKPLSFLFGRYGFRVVCSLKEYRINLYVRGPLCTNNVCLALANPEYYERRYFHWCSLASQCPSIMTGDGYASPMDMAVDGHRYCVSIQSSRICSLPLGSYPELDITDQPWCGIDAFGRRATKYLANVRVPMSLYREWFFSYGDHLLFFYRPSKNGPHRIVIAFLGLDDCNLFGSYRMSTLFPPGFSPSKLLEVKADTPPPEAIIELNPSTLPARGPGDVYKIASKPSAKRSAVRRR